MIERIKLHLLMPNQQDLSWQKIRLQNEKKKIMKFSGFSRKRVRVCSKMILYLMIETSEKAKNFVSMVTFHALSNDISHLEIKKFSDAGLVEWLMDPLLMMTAVLSIAVCRGF